LVSEFDFPKAMLPQFYKQEDGLMETLQVLVQSSKDVQAEPSEHFEPVKKKKRQEEKKVQKEEHKEEEVYFDCNVMNKFDANIVFDKVNNNPPQKLDA
jgi:hypothetical protein